MNINSGRASMANNVREGFLENTEECRVHIGFFQGFFYRSLHAALDARLTLELIGLPFDCRQQAHGVQQPWAQFRGDATDCVNDLIDVFGH